MGAAIGTLDQQVWRTSTDPRMPDACSRTPDFKRFGSRTPSLSTSAPSATRWPAMAPGFMRSVTRHAANCTARHRRYQANPGWTTAGLTARLWAQRGARLRAW